MKYCWEVSSKTIRRLRDCYCIRFLGLKVSDRNFSAKKNFPGLVQKAFRVFRDLSGSCLMAISWEMFPKKNSGKSRGNLSFNVCWFLFRHTSQKAFSRHMRCLWGYLPKWFLAFGRDIFQKVAGYIFFLGDITPRVFNERFAKQNPLRKRLMPYHPIVSQGTLSEIQTNCFETYFAEISPETILKYGSGIYFPGLSWEGSPATYFQKILSEIFQENSQRILWDMQQKIHQESCNVCWGQMDCSKICSNICFEWLWKILPEKTNVMDLLGSCLMTSFGRCFPKYSSRKCRGNLAFNVYWIFFRHTSQQVFSIQTQCFWGNIYLPIFSCLWASWIHFFSWEISPEGFQREICQTDPPWGKGGCHITPEFFKEYFLKYKQNMLKHILRRYLQKQYFKYFVSYTWEGSPIKYFQPSFFHPSLTTLSHEQRKFQGDKGDGLSSGQLFMCLKKKGLRFCRKKFRSSQLSWLGG